MYLPIARLDFPPAHVAAACSDVFRALSRVRRRIFCEPKRGQRKSPARGASETN